MMLADTFIGRWWFNAEPLSQGPKRLISMALGDDRQTSGVFYLYDKPTPEADEVLDKENKEKIWDLCVKYSGL